MVRKSAWELAKSGASFRELLIDAVDEFAWEWEAAADDRAATFEQVNGWMQKYQGPLGRWAVGAVLEQMGLNLQDGEELSRESFTRMVNDGPLEGTGIRFSNLFDRQAVIDDLMMIGLKKAAEAAGIPMGDGAGLESLKTGLRQQFAGAIAEQVASESGELIDGAPDAARIVQVITQAVKAENWNDPVDFSAKGVNNRERQARWRAANRKIWIDR